MEGWLDDLADDLQSVSFSSATTTTTAYGGAAVNRSNSSGSDTVPSSSAAASGHGSYPISAADLRLIRRLGAGDIGAVYLAELKSSKGVFFAVKLMDRKELAGRRKENRARTERELLKLLDHPFLPTLYASFDSANFSGLLTEFCPGGDLHVLRQKQAAKRFDEAAVRFYVAEVVAALEYIHMKGIIYRDLKPENVLVRADGHIMLTDFDLSLRCDDSLAQVLSQQRLAAAAGPVYRPSSPATSSILPACIVPGVSCLRPRWRRKKKPPRHPRTQFVAEPTDVRSMSFVGTHEYLAPEIVSGEGHGSAVDWWTLGVFMFELLYGVTPFKGADNDLTLANIVARALEFPKDPPVSSPAKDLLTQLLVKDPCKRLGAAMGSVSVKRNPFFLGTNWALLRCAAPPYIPPPFNRDSVSDRSCSDTTMEYY